jgi:hypothetical protein
LRLKSIPARRYSNGNSEIPRTGVKVRRKLFAYPLHCSAAFWKRYHLAKCCSPSSPSS